MRGGGRIRTMSIRRPGRLDMFAILIGCDGKVVVGWKGTR